MRVDKCKKLEETMHLYIRHLCQDSTFDLFQFCSNLFIQNLSCQTRGAAYTPVFTVHCNFPWEFLPWHGLFNNYSTSVRWI